MIDNFCYFVPEKVKLSWSPDQILNPVSFFLEVGGGGGGVSGPDEQIHSCYSETSYSIMSKLCDF